jgi:hypothetical protein
MYGGIGWSDSAVAWCRAQGCTADDVSLVDYYVELEQDMYGQLEEAFDNEDNDEDEQ